MEHTQTTQLAGTAALVTGGSRGIGRAVALALAGAGADVALTYRADEGAAKDVAERIRGMGRTALAIQADAADPQAPAAAVDRAAEALGRLDILVSNAAVYPTGPIEDFDADAFDRIVAANVRGPYLAARAALAHLPRGGRIIAIGSNVADRTPFPGLTLYALTKTALVGLTKGLARDLGPRGITVNLVHPGATDTDANPADGPFAPTVRGLTALDRYADPAEIAATVVHLASPAASYTTGAAIHVDGGFTV
ncbi:3-oxoacyl-[acyl-carrier protein] reductase [Actinacidiphila yanglinensis]|uniref:3-oxoacyl-[acyl-carrier protein] reductase n=1 Tax=Actinacidiphila yanglinensis TaxID=310779 RepID=A0A1H5W2K1_9ACTN|nr:SDR family oxidoreductase [Actinacidiphila yanglinensis]SEF93047.1 3-oxoacyl-[acyl-carrier protein] reductase [Actinacidiphila yanglinensis]